MVVSKRHSGVISPVNSSVNTPTVDVDYHGDKNSQPRKEQWRVFSSNPDKAWAEKVFLAYSPVWPVLFGAWCISGLHLQAGDAGNLGVTLLIALPDVLIPMLFCPSHARMPWWQTYWFKYLVWIAIFTFVASYFWTEYFFDVLGMK
jgi:cycloeucalenol cycloisomerase